MWTRKRHPKDLKTILTYRNSRVVQVFLRNTPIAREQAEALFQETLKWLWLCRVHDHDLSNEKGKRVPRELAIYPPMRLVDEMWHAFILCTEDYERFCSGFLGRFIHHEPNVDSTDLSPPDSYDSVEREKLLRYIVTKLGPDTLKAWFLEIPQWQIPATP